MSAGTTEIVNQQNGQLQERPVTLPARQIRVVEDHGVNASLLDTGRFEHMQRIATVMANCALIPEHLLGKMKKGQETQWYDEKQVIGNCFLIVNQALRWGFDPFAVAAETYVVSGKLGFQGKLIAALVNTRANLKSRLRYEYNDKQGDALEITVIGCFADEDDDRTIKMTVGQGRTSNDMWSKDAPQKLYYSAVTKWARRHCPEVIMGVFTDDDLDRMRDSQKAVESESTNKLSNLIGSGALKGDTPIPEEVDRRTLPKTRKRKETPEAAVEPEKPTDQPPVTKEEEPTKTEDPKSLLPTETNEPLPTIMEEMEAYAKKEGCICIASDPEGSFSEWRMVNDSSVVFTTKQMPSREGRYCVLTSDSDATKQMVDIINHAKAQAAKRS